MAALTLDALLRSLKKGPQPPIPAPVYLLHGAEDVLKGEAIRAILDAALGSSRDFNFDSRFAADLTPESFHLLVNTPPMFAERRAVVVRGVEQLAKRKSRLRDEVLRYLASPSPSTVLVLVAAAGEDVDAELTRHTVAVDVKPLDAERVPRWLTHYGSSLGLTLNPDAADLLVSAVGNDLSMLARELEKLAAFTGGRTATVEDVTGLVGVRRGETVYDLIEAALERRAARAAQLVEPVLEQAGMNGVRIISLLGTHLVGTAVARVERNPHAVLRHMLAARPYGLRGYKEEAARWSKWSALWTAPELGRALRATLKADIALKTATMTDDRGIVTQLILGFAPRKREAA
jgi:DNA polymerase-3 subunit delta